MKEEKEIPTAESMIDPDSYSDESGIGKGMSKETTIKLMIEFTKLCRDHIKKSLLLKSRVVVSTEEPGYLKITMDDFKKIFAEEIK